MPSYLVATIAGAALVAGGFAAGVGTRSASALPGSTVLTAAAAAPAVTAGQCQVEVRRSGGAGTSDIRRRQFDNGDCVCVITTGPSPVNGSAEDIVRALLRDRQCTDALAPADLGPAEIGTAGATGGGMGGVILPVVFGVGAVGLGAALGGSSKG